MSTIYYYKLIFWLDFSKHFSNIFLNGYVKWKQRWANKQRNLFLGPKISNLTYFKKVNNIYYIFSTVRKIKIFQAISVTLYEIGISSLTLTQKK